MIGKVGKEGTYKIDYLLVGVVSLVVLLGILMIYSAGFDPIDKVNSGMYKKQLLWFIFGFILMMMVTFVNYQHLGDYSLYIYGILLVLLLITTIFGTPIRNTRAWLSFGFFSIQPSEFMKLGLVIVLGKYLELRERDIKNFRELLIPSLLTIFPAIIVLKQPDFGTAVIFIPILFAMLFVGGADVSHLISIIAIAAIALIVPMIITYREWIGEGSNTILDFFKDVNMLFLISGIILVISIICFVLNFFIVKKILRKIYIPGSVISIGLLSFVVIHKIFNVY